MNSEMKVKDQVERKIVLDCVTGDVICRWVCYATKKYPSS